MTDESEDDRMRRLMHDQYQRPLAKRFYKSVGIGPANEILLDGRQVKTPLKLQLQLPNRGLAEAVASEWAAQTDVINPGNMPLTRLANAAIDRAGPQRDALIAEIVDYANADLVCYRADRPPDLVALQSRHWDPVVAWAKSSLDADFVSTIGMMHHQQAEASRNAIAKAVSLQDGTLLTATYNLVTLLGSALIPLMHLDGALSADEAWSAAHVDEDYQISLWGLDSEAENKRIYRRQEFDAFVRFADLLRA